MPRARWARNRLSSPSSAWGKRSNNKSAMMKLSTPSPRNSRRSLLSLPTLRWVSAVASRAGCENGNRFVFENGPARRSRRPTLQLDAVIVEARHHVEIGEQRHAFLVIDGDHRLAGSARHFDVVFFESDVVDVEPTIDAALDLDRRHSSDVAFFLQRIEH